MTDQLLNRHWPKELLERIITDGGKTNGVLVSPDQKTLYASSIEAARERLWSLLL